MGRFLTLCLSALFILAALSKWNDPRLSTVFVQYHLQKWSLPVAYDTYVVGALIFCEFLLGALLAFFGNQRWLVIVTGALLVAYSSVLVASLFDANAPSCACLGALTAKAQAKHANLAGLIRNAGLLGMCVYLQGSAPSPSLSRSTRGLTTCPKATLNDSRAFTVIELLVSICIIGLIMAVSIPALAGVRKRAKITQELMTARQLAVATTMYTESSRTMFPYMGKAGQPLAPLSLGGQTLPHTAAYFQQAVYYASLLYPQYYSDRRSIESEWWTGQASTCGTMPDLLGSRFMLTQTAFAAPTYFGDFATPTDVSLYRPVRAGECVFPSAKILILDASAGIYGVEGDPLYIKGKVVVSNADASGDVRDFDTESSNVSYRPLFALPWAGMTTHEGIAGRDF